MNKDRWTCDVSGIDFGGRAWDATPPVAVGGREADHLTANAKCHGATAGAGEKPR